MKTVKFVLSVLFMIIFTHPNRWKWEYKQLKDKINSNNLKMNDKDGY